MDDLLFTGSYSFWTTKFLPAVTSKFNVNYTELKGNGSFISFLKRKLVKINDGLLLVPGTTANKVVSCFEKFFGVAKQQKIPCDGSIQNDDKSQKLSDGDSKAYRSVIGLLLYAARDRVDVMFAVTELSAYMAAPTVCALQKLRKLIGYLKANGDMGIKLCIPEFGTGKWKKGGEKFWNVETFTDADWSAHKTHRRSTSCAVHFINNNLAYASSRTQRVVSLSSAESELHSMVSGCSDAIFLRRCMEFLTGDEIEQWQWVDNSAARQLIERQGVGRVRHPSGKILWMQSLVLEKQIKLGQVPTQWNVSDVGTKPLRKQRLLVLLHQIGCCNPDTHEMVGQEEYEAFEERTVGKQMVKRILQGYHAYGSAMGSWAQPSRSRGGKCWRGGLPTGSGFWKQWRKYMALVCSFSSLHALGWTCGSRICCMEEIFQDDNRLGIMLESGCRWGFLYSKTGGENWPSDSTPWTSPRTQWTGPFGHFRSNYRMQQWVEHDARLCIGTSLQHCRTWRFLAKWMWSQSRTMVPSSNARKSKSG